MKILVTAILAGFTGLAIAGETVVYTTEAYCELDKYNSGVYGQAYTKAYGDKLGTLPSNQLCSKLLKEKFASVEKFDGRKKWNYKFNLASRGSVQKLPEKTVAMLREAGIYHFDI